MLAVLTTIVAFNAEARDLHGRLGLGFNNQFANTRVDDGVPAVSLKYAFARDLAGDLIFGIKTGTPSNSVTGLKLYKVIFFETNLNFYSMFGAAIVRGRTSGTTRTGNDFLAGFGAEFFIPGIESLGFSFETGASFDNLTGSYVFRTMGVNLLNAGMHFYF